jgi:hypothetical protein
MNRFNAAVFYSMTSSSAKGRGQGGHGSNKMALLFAMGIACLWAARPCKRQIEVDAYISNEASDSVSVINTSSAAGGQRHSPRCRSRAYWRCRDARRQVCLRYECRPRGGNRLYGLRA